MIDGKMPGGHTDGGDGNIKGYSYSVTKMKDVILSRSAVQTKILAARATEGELLRLLASEWQLRKISVRNLLVVSQFEFGGKW
jgi:hypothetical protein